MTQRKVKAIVIITKRMMELWTTWKILTRLTIRTEGKAMVKKRMIREVTRIRTMTLMKNISMTMMKRTTSTTVSLEVRTTREPMNRSTQRMREAGIGKKAITDMAVSIIKAKDIEISQRIHKRQATRYKPKQLRTAN